MWMSLRISYKAGLVRSLRQHLVRPLELISEEGQRVSEACQLLPLASCTAVEPVIKQEGPLMQGQYSFNKTSKRTALDGSFSFSSSFL